MRYLILTEGGGELGWGHLMRCSALASELEKLSLQGEMLIDWRGVAKPPNLPVSCRCHDWQADFSAIKSLIVDADVVILDSYQCKPSLIDDFIKLNRNMVFFDDYQHRDYSCGIVVDPTPLAEHTGYPLRRSSVNYCLGLPWACIRREFSANRFCRVFRDASHILLALGAGVELLSECIDIILGVYPESQIHVIVRESNTSYFKSEKLHIYKNIDANSLCRVIDLCDFGVVAGGQTLYEVLARCLPVIAFPVVDNQECDISFFRQSGAIHVVDKNDCFREGLEVALLDMTSPKGSIDYYSMTDSVDGLGAKRLAENIIDVFGVNGVIWQ